jgi:putative transposase
VKYGFISAHARAFSIVSLCRVLGVSTSGYYDWEKRPSSVRAETDKQLAGDIKAIHRESREAYGYLRVHAKLESYGIACGKHRAARLMRENGLKSKATVHRELWSKGKNVVKLPDNVLDRNFFANRANEKWVSDITVIPTQEGILHLAVVIDLYSRAVVGWSMSARPTSKMVLDAVKMAIGRREDVRNLLLHSDQGVQYRSSEYRTLLDNHGIQVSMSRKGNCWDNAVVESFFHTLKTELVHHVRYASRAEAKRSLFDYIEIFYNRQRSHSYLNYKSPAEFEAMSGVP